MRMLRPAFLALTGCVMMLAATHSTTGAQTRLAALPASVPAPADNPTTPERAALGRLLFWDPILSGQKDVACATCHHPAYGYTDGLDVSLGVSGAGLGPSRVLLPDHPARLVKRNSQTILNAAFNGLTSRAEADPVNAPMFWDMRVRSLETQALQPIKSLEEMRAEAYAEGDALSAVVSRLNEVAEYRRLFTAAFGGTAPVTEANLGRAIAAFERTLVTSNAPFDRYVRGDAAALDPEQVQGMERFQSAGCINCHNGPMLSDFTAHVLGVPDNPKLPESDAGINKTYAFRTPSLRNLGATAPYMHNGTFTTLQQVVNFYNRISRGGGRRGGGGGRGGRGGGFRGGFGAPALNAQVSRDQIDPIALELNMRGRGQQDLVAFLRALDDPSFDRTVPDRVPSGLPVGGRLQR